MDLVLAWVVFLWREMKSCILDFAGKNGEIEGSKDTGYRRMGPVGRPFH